MKKTLTLGKIKHNPWFDFECRARRRHVRQALRKFMNSKNESETNELRTAYIQSNVKQYKLLTKVKKSEHKENVLENP